MAAIEKTTSSLVEVLDRILDKGIVIDAWIAISVIGIELVTIEARVIVASLETYVKYSEALYMIGPVAGGRREQNKDRTLGDVLKDVNQGVKDLPIVGSAAQTGGSQASQQSQSQKRQGNAGGATSRKTTRRKTTRSKK